MRHLALLASVYALIAALVLPGSLLASEEGAPAASEPSGQTAPAEAPPAPAAGTDEAPAPAPAEPAPAPAEPAPAPPAPQFLADERAEGQPAARAAQSGAVTISDFEFTPAQITVEQGDTVTWTNDGPAAHSATAPDGSFDTGVFPAGESRSHTFDEAGTFSYICTPHPNMQGTVVVNAAQTGGDTPDSSDGDTSGSTGTGTAGGESAQADGPTLPNSGVDSGAMLVLGALMLLLGAAVRRQARGVAADG